MEAPIPVFKKCVIVGPDKVKRDGWEMQVNVEILPLVVRDTSRQSLEEIYERIFHEPPPSLHWRNTRTRGFRKSPRKIV